jgi:hypothetical protein
MLGVCVLGAFDTVLARNFDTCVTSGYFGPATIDMAFASRAGRICFIADPIEARIAIWDLQNRFRQYSDHLPETVESSFSGLIDALEVHAARNTETVSLSSLDDFGLTPQISNRTVLEHASSVSADYVTISFTDGSILEATSNSRFVVLGKSQRFGLQSMPAKDLKPGYQVVLVEQQSRDTFAETIMAAVDEGRYRRQSDTRRSWLSLVQTMCETREVTPSAISRKLRQAGFSIDPSTVRTWLRAHGDGPAVPERMDWFKAFAEALGLALPDETLEDWFKDIRRLRIAHRAVGRDLARAIRGAYLGQLDAPTLQRLERDWGVKAIELITAARVATVDDVFDRAAGEQHAAQ